MTTRRRTTHLTATAVLLAALVGCAADPETTPPEQDEAAIEAGYEIVMDDGLAFAPEVLTDPAGTVVQVVNRSSRAHTLTADDGAPGEFDLGPVPEGGTAELRIDEPGRYPYHCELHPGVMDGVIVVE